MQLSAVVLAVAARPGAPARAPRSAACRSTRSTQAALEAQVRQIARRARGTVGVAALDLERGARLDVDGAAPVFMSSVVKLPLAVQLLARVDRGELHLGDSIALAARDLRVGNGGLAAEHPEGGVTLTVGELLRRAVSESDNSASDALLRYSGGPGRVVRELRALGVAGIRVDRSYAENTWLYNGIDHPPPAAAWTPALIARTTGAATPAQRDRGAARFLADRGDRASAAAVAALLARLARGELLSQASRGRLLGLMTASANPRTRLVAGAPPGARVAHKTGTWGGWRGVQVAVNDVGIVELPGGGRVVLAVLIGGGRAGAAEQDAVIADITRAVVRAWSAPAGSTPAGSAPAGGA